MTNTNPQVIAIGAALALLVTASPALAQTHAAPAHPAARPTAHAAHAHTAPAHAASAHAATSPHAVDPDGVVNIQTATVEQLQLLPGIGPSKAEAIIRYRGTHPFARVEDILRVRGIGRVTFRRLRPMITVSGATTMTTDVHATAHGAATPEAAPAATATE
jgi:competence protein ComEA